MSGPRGPQRNPRITNDQIYDEFERFHRKMDELNMRFARIEAMTNSLDVQRVELSVRLDHLIDRFNIVIAALARTLEQKP